MIRPVTSLGHQEGRRVFREGPKFLKLCPIVLKNVQHIFPAGRKILQAGLRPLLPPGYGPADDQEEMNNFYQHDKLVQSHLVAMRKRRSYAP